MSSGQRRPFTIASLVALAAGFLLLWPVPRDSVVHAQAGGPGQIAVFSQQSVYSVPLLPFGSQPYVGLVDLLEPLGSVEAKVNGKKLKLSFSYAGNRQQEIEFREGKNEVKVNGKKLKLTANFALQNGRGYVPLSSVSELLPRLGLQPVQYRPGSQRLLIGEVAERFTAELKRGMPSRLLLGFPAAVNPTIATEPGKVRLTFKRDPVVAPTEPVKYNDPLITGTSFSEHDGIAELDITGAAPLMANFADGGKTIIVTAAPGPAPTQAVQKLPVTVTQEATTLPQQAPQPPPHPRFLVIIDPAHGGTDIGAAITPQLPEKDVVLALARRVQHELQAKGITAALLRNGDYAISLDQRAASINADRPALYIVLHAANTGKGIHVFTALLPAENISPGQFLPWDTAQAAFSDLSGAVAGSIAAELENRKLPNTTLAVALRPVNNVAAPAVAIEIAPPDANVSDIASANYQTEVAQSIAAGVVAVRSKLPEVNP